MQETVKLYVVADHRPVIRPFASLAAMLRAMWFELFFCSRNLFSGKVENRRNFSLNAQDAKRLSNIFIDATEEIVPLRLNKYSTAGLWKQNRRKNILVRFLLNYKGLRSTVFRNLTQPPLHGYQDSA